MPTQHDGICDLNDNGRTRSTQTSLATKRTRSVVVIPCFNEAERLQPAKFHSFCARNPTSRILFVDDGSTDHTQYVLSDLVKQSSSQLSLLTLPENAGKAEAIRRGVLAALRSRPDFIGYFDADLATPLDAVAQFADVLERRRGVDCVLGARLPMYGHNIQRTRTRHWMGRLFATVAAAAIGVHVHDTQCGAKMFRTGRLLEHVFSQPFNSRWIFDVELLARMRVAISGDSTRSMRDVVYELPLDNWYERGGSRLKSSDYWLAIRELWTLHLKYRHAAYPEWQLHDYGESDVEDYIIPIHRHLHNDNNDDATKRAA